jgi:hypothetical protein
MATRTILVALALIAGLSPAMAQAQPAKHCAPAPGLWSILTSPPACGFAKAHHHHHTARSGRHRAAGASVPIPRESPQRPAWIRAAEEHFVSFAAENPRCWDELWERAEIAERPALMEFRDFVLRRSDDAFAATRRGKAP